MKFRFVSLIAMPVVLGLPAFSTAVSAAQLPPAATLCASAEARPARFVKRADFMEAVTAMTAVCPDVVLMLLDQPTLTIPAVAGSGGESSDDRGIDDSGALAALRAAIADMIATNASVDTARATLEDLQPRLFSRTKADPAAIEAAKAELNKLLEDQFYAWTNAEQVLKDVAAVRTVAVANESKRLTQKITEAEGVANSADELLSPDILIADEDIVAMAVPAEEIVDAPLGPDEQPAADETAPAEETPPASATTEVLTEEPAT